MESNHQNILSCLWYTVLFFQWCFSHKRNVYCDRVSKTYRLVDTMYHHRLLILEVSHEYRPNLQWIFLLLTCFYLLRCLVRESLFFGSMTTQNHVYSELTLINVSLTMYFEIFLLLDDVFSGLYSWIQFHITTCLLLTICKKECFGRISEIWSKKVQIQTWFYIQWRYSVSLNDHIWNGVSSNYNIFLS